MGKRKKLWIQRNTQRASRWMRHHPIDVAVIRKEGIINTGFVGAVVAFETPKRIVLMHKEWLHRWQLFRADP